MCTIILVYKVLQDFPIVIAHNRDELRTRDIGKPPRILSDKPKIIAPQDTTAKGTWMGFNEYGLVNSLTNVEQTDLKPKAKSRGLLVLGGLGKDSCQGLEAYTLDELKNNPFNYFNLLYADNDSAYTLTFKGDVGEVDYRPLSVGLHILPSSQLDNGNNPERRRNRINELYHANGSRDIDELLEKIMLICSDHYGEEGGSKESICMHSDLTATVSSTIIAVHRDISNSRIFHAQGPPCQNRYGDYSGILN